MKIIQHFFSTFTAGALAVASLGLFAPAAPAADVKNFFIAKGQDFFQENGGNPVSAGFFLFDVEARTGEGGLLYSVVVSNATAGAVPLVEGVGPEAGLFFNGAEFDSKAELNTLFPAGPYTFFFEGDNDAPTNATLNLPADAYPSTPHFANWAAAQAIDSLAPFVLRWDAFSGGNSNDLIRVFIYDDMGPVFETPDIFEPGALTGQSNSVVIPAGQMVPGQTYGASLLFVNVVSVDTTSYPGAKGVVGFYKETSTTISNENIPPQGRIQFASTNLVVDETGVAINVSLDRVGGTEGDVIVLLSSVGLTATSGTDFTPISHRVAFPNGVSNVTVTLSILDDYLLEGTERLRLGLGSPEDGVALTRNTNAIVTITDNESAAAGLLSFSAAMYPVTEGVGAEAKIIVRRTGGTAGNVQVSLDLVGGDAASDDDFEAVPDNSFFVAIAAGQSAATNVITILDDTLPEGEETISLRLADPTGGARPGPIANAIVKIIDDEVSLQFSQAAYTNIENRAAAVINVNRTGPVTEMVSVDFSVGLPFAMGSAFIPASITDATAGADYLTNSGTLVFGPGVRTKTFTVSILDDLEVENPFEYIGLYLANPTDALLGPLRTAVLSIKENDLGGSLAFTLTNQSVKEAVGDAKIIVIRAGGLASNVTVRLSAVDGTAMDGADFLGFSSNLTFTAKEGRKTIPLKVIQDFLVEPTENLLLTLREVSANAALGSKTNLTLSIKDDDKGGTVAFDKGTYTVNEGVGSLSIIVKRTGGSASNVTVQFFTENGTATAGSDYTAIDTTLSFAPGETRKTNVLTIIDDGIADAPLPETVNLRLRDITGGAKLALSNSVVSIVDNEASLNFRATTATGTEGKSLNLEVVRGGFLGNTSTVAYMFMNGTATNGLDFTGTDGTLTFLPGQATRTITVPILGDPNTETAENFTVLLKNPTAALLGADTNATVTVLDAPDKDAISGSGSAFFKATITGIEGNSLSKTINIGNSAPNVISSAYTTSLGWLNLSGLNNKFSNTSSSARVVNNWLQFINTHVNAPGVVDLGFNSGNGGVVWTFNDATTRFSGGQPTIHENHAYGTGRSGSSGNITIDVLNLDGHVVAGRFNFIAIEDGGNKKVRITGSFRSTGTIVN